jgi:hypothetical protein
VDIRTKNTGKTFYQIDPQLAAVLLELGMVERIDKPAVVDPNPPGPKWGVTVNRGGSTCIVLTVGQTTQWFDGHPEDAPTGFQRKDWKGSITGPETPAHIVELYKAQLMPTDWTRISIADGFAKRKRK